ncbi:hypothetical protein MKW92_004119 [Papaver armeniacum]|nr:hypothetical protein MKW92_004119 [Papaver armeniacum]
MEGKSPALSAVVIGVLLIGLFLARTFVEADTPCCTGYNQQKCFHRCREESDRDYCTNWCGCHSCVLRYPNIKVGGEEKKEQTLPTANDYCKLGCASSVCSNIIALYESAGHTSELKEAAKRCNNACFQFCNKKSDTAAVAAN